MPKNRNETLFSIKPASKGLEKEYEDIFNKQAQEFVIDLVIEFESRIETLYRDRQERKVKYEDPEVDLPVIEVSPEVSSEAWQIAPLPSCLQNRNIDLGDVSPSNDEHLKQALNSKVQGVQMDFDDGHCPSWTNQIKGIHNVMAIVQGKFYPKEVPPLHQAPLLLLRPRAWNMNEHNFTVKGKEIPGPIMDFGLLIFHTGKALAVKDLGPFFYLSKLESAFEARLWNDIFTWAENRLGLTPGIIKACVLVESIPATFAMERILYELRHHSLGLNCGIWDYSASIINKFGKRKGFIIPERSKYVNMDTSFLQNYAKLVVQTCHKHGAPATGGMAAVIMSSIHKSKQEERKMVVEKVCKSKQKDIEMGLDGFLVYDSELVPALQELWNRSSASSTNQLAAVVDESKLLNIPHGGVTLVGLEKNIRVAVLFVYSWLYDANGHFVLDGIVEDSATAEISRSQVWQWIYHRVKLEDGNQDPITEAMVTTIIDEIISKLLMTEGSKSYNKDDLEVCKQLFMELVTSCRDGFASRMDPPEFITSYIYNHPIFRERHET